MKVEIPGKSMLSGEYAVLVGGEAVLVPVPRYLTVEESTVPTPDDLNPVIHEALSIPIPELTEIEPDLAPLHVSIDRSGFTAFENGVGSKLGLGGSAAEAVGVIALRFERAGRMPTETPDLLFELADTAHRRAQGGIGSGADVAACTWRRPIRFRRTGDGSAIVEPVSAPAPEYVPPLHLIYTGVPANTRELIQPFLDWSTRNTTAEALLSGLRKAAHDLAVAWFTVELDDLFERLDAFTARMDEIATRATIPWRLPVHHQLEMWARRHGARLKPTGAGGGDLALLIGDAPVDRLDQITIRLDPFAAH